MPGLDSTTATSTSGCLERLRVVHLRHRPRVGRAEGAARDQPHRHAAGVGRPAGDHRVARRPPGPGQIAVTSDLDQDELSARLEASTLSDLQQIDDVRDATLLGTTAQAHRDHPGHRRARRGRVQQPVDPRRARRQRRAARPRARSPRTTAPSSCRAGTRLTSADDIAALPLLGGSADPVLGADGTISLPVTTIGDVADVAVVDDPVTGYLARQRRAGADHLDHQDPGRQHGRGVEGGARRAPRPRRGARRRREVHHRVRPGAVHRAVDRVARAGGPARPRCSPSSSSSSS